jgi:antitoxin (DNA-binding transcriptional repressor) of toxin-antitoxin stability system
VVVDAGSATGVSGGEVGAVSTGVVEVLTGDGGTVAVIVGVGERDSSGWNKAQDTVNTNSAKNAAPAERGWEAEKERELWGIDRRPDFAGA